jgi:NADPH:quinone reductase-like Zn-dependent oxidoreductase
VCWNGLRIGKNTTTFATGDLIFGMTNQFSGGVHSEYAVLDATEITLAPIRHFDCKSLMYPA